MADFLDNLSALVSAAAIADIANRLMADGAERVNVESRVGQYDECGHWQIEVHIDNEKKVVPHCFMTIDDAREYNDLMAQHLGEIFDVTNMTYSSYN